MKLRQYQEQLAQDTWAAILQGEAPVSVLATGGGKSLTMSEVVRLALTDPESPFRRVVVACHLPDILAQLEKDLLPLGKVSWLHGQKLFNPAAKIFLVSTPTFLERAKNPDWSGYTNLISNENTLWLLDEAHRSTSGKAGEIILSTKSRITGWTATPWSEGLSDKFTCLIAGPLPSQLMEAGYLVKPKWVVPETVLNTEGQPVVMGDWNMAAMSKHIRSIPEYTQKCVAQVFKSCPTGQFIFFVCDKLHAEQVGNILTDLGRRYELVLSDGSAGREAQLARLHRTSRDPQPIHGISIDVLSTGIDIPYLRGIVCLRPTMSTMTFWQQVGRALRAPEGKTEAVIFDFAGNSVSRHLRPEKLEAYSFLPPRSTGTRDIGMKECPQCARMCHSILLQCPGCRYLFEDSCAGCNRPIHFKTAICRFCGHDRREEEEKAAAEKAATERVSAFKAEKLFNLDKIRQLRYNYTRIVRLWYAGGPVSNLLAANKKLKVENLQVTQNTLFESEPSKRLYKKMYDRLTACNVPSSEILECLGFQFGPEARKWYIETILNGRIPSTKPSKKEV